MVRVPESSSERLRAARRKQLPWISFVRLLLSHWDLLRRLILLWVWLLSCSWSSCPPTQCGGGRTQCIWRSLVFGGVIVGWWGR